MPFFWDEKKGKLVQTQKVVSSAAVAKLKEIKALVDGMRKDDGGLGSYFHETAVKLAEKAAEKGKAKYIEKWDCMVEPKEMEQAEKFFGIGFHSLSRKSKPVSENSGRYRRTDRDKACANQMKTALLFLYWGKIKGNFVRPAPEINLR